MQGFPWQVLPALVFALQVHEIDQPVIDLGLHYLLVADFVGLRLFP